MKKPWFRGSSGTWVVTLDGGRIKTLGKDEHGATRKNPPRHIVEVWHELISKQTGNKPGESHKPKDMRLKDLAEEYLNFLTHEKTRSGTRQHLDWLIEYMGDIKVSQIEVHKIMAYLASKKTWGGTTKATALERITAAINWAIGVQRLDKTYRLEVPKHMKPRRQPRKTVIKPDIMKTLEESANPPLAALLKALRLTGARPGEMCNAMIENCDLKAGTLKVLNKTRNKTNLEFRTIYLSAEMQELVRGQVGRRTEGHIFLKLNGTPWNIGFLSNMVWKLKKRLGLKGEVFPYAIRHTYVTNGIEAGIDVVTLGNLVGHAGIDMIKKHYANPSVQHYLEAIRKLDDSLSSDKTEGKS